MRNETENLIATLASDLKPFPRPETLGHFLLKWSAAASVLCLLALGTLRLREDFGARAEDLRFWLETAGWLCAAVAAAILARRSAIPALLKARDALPGAVLLAGLALLVLSRFEPLQALPELRGELDLFRGRCGPLILLFGATGSAGLMLSLRRLAPTRLDVTGAWTAVSMGCVSSLAMQFVCAHDNPLHLLLWHALPVAVLSLAGARAGRRILAW